MTTITTDQKSLLTSLIACTQKSGAPCTHALREYLYAENVEKYGDRASWRYHDSGSLFESCLRDRLWTLERKGLVSSVEILSGRNVRKRTWHVMAAGLEAAE